MIKAAANNKLEPARKDCTQVSIHLSEQPEASRAALLRALAQGHLPGKWLYQSPAQAALWLAYHQAFSPSRSNAHVTSGYREVFDLAAREFTAEAVQVVGLGSGGGQKDALLLGALRERSGYWRPGLYYVPVDASVPLTLESAARVNREHPTVTVSPLALDLENIMGFEPAAQSAEDWLDDWLDNAAPEGAGRLISCLGMLPNLDPERFPRWLAARLKEKAGPERRLILSANLSPGGLAADRERILAQYDNPPARRWYAGALAELGLGPERYRLEIATRPLAGGRSETAEDDAWQIEVLARFDADHTLDLFGAQVSIKAGRPLRVFFSNRFSRRGLVHRLEHAGLTIQAFREFAGGEEGVLLCRI